MHLQLPHYGHQVSCSSIVESFLSEWEGGKSLCLHQCSDIEKLFLKNYILLCYDEEVGLSTGLTKPPAKPIGKVLQPRSLDMLREGDVCVFGVPFDTACVPPYSPAHGPTVIRESYLHHFSDESCVLSDLGNVIKWPEDGLSTAGKRVEHLIRRVLGASALPIVLGGDHSMTYFSLKALSEIGYDFALLQLDAHADFAVLGDSVPLNHANVISYCMNLKSLKHLTQVGLRGDANINRAAHIAGRSITVNEFRKCSVDVLIGELPQLPVYLTVDMDVLDPEVAPEVTTPLANGLTKQELVDLVSTVAHRCTLVGVDIVEVCATPYKQNRAAQCAAELLAILARKGDSQ